MSWTTPAALLALALSSSPAAQELRFEIRGVGSGVAAIGDLDRDGAAELLVGGWPVRCFSVRTKRSLFELSASAAEHALSSVAASLGDPDGDGADELLLDTFAYPASALLEPPGRSPLTPWFAYFPPAPSTAGWLAGAVVLDDLDGDGFREVATGWPDAYFVRCGGDQATVVSGETGGSVQVHSGRDGHVLFVSQGAVPGEALGGVLARIGDVDGDGLADIAAATRYYNYSYNFFCFNGGGNYVRVLSSRTGATIWQTSGAPRSIATLGDVDRDGVADLALGFPRLGRIELRSGRTGEVLRTLLSAGSVSWGSVWLGHTLVPLPDMDGDGREDLLTGAPDPIDRFGPGGPGRAVVLSSASGKPLHVLRGERVGQQFGASLAQFGDVDGDGRVEIAVGSAGEPGGLVQVFSLPSPASRPARVR